MKEDFGSIDATKQTSMECTNGVQWLFQLQGFTGTIGKVTTTH